MHTICRYYIVIVVADYCVLLVGDCYRLKNIYTLMRILLRGLLRENRRIKNENRKLIRVWRVEESWRVRDVVATRPCRNPEFSEFFNLPPIKCLTISPGQGVFSQKIKQLK
jgi:hypothetical protein